MARRPGNPRWSSGNPPAPLPKLPGELKAGAMQI